MKNNRITSTIDRELPIVERRRQFHLTCLRWLLILGMTLIYWIYSRAYNGPAYLGDEIGYLSNAIYLSGYMVDGASSYFAGYSLLLSPLFVIFPTASSIWQGAMALNALLWALSFYLVDRLITLWWPDVTLFNRIFLLFICALYPAWVTMSGYVFASSVFVAFFMGGIVSFFSLKSTNTKSIYFLTFVVGYLTWIHPTGLAVAGASVLVVSLWSIKEKSYRCGVIHAFGVAIMLLGYRYAVHPWLINAMTPSNYTPLTHYPTIAEIFTKFGEIDYWILVGSKAIGQISYLIIGTFGIALFGLVELMRRAKVFWTSKHTIGLGDAAAAYTSIAVFAVITIGASGSTALRVDHWIYGRYLDGVAMPLIACGAMAFLRMKLPKRALIASLAIAFVLVSGVLIGVQSVPTASNNIVNTPSFWPQYIMTEVNIEVWMAVGAAALCLVSIGGKKVASAAAIASFIVSSGVQSRWHTGILEGYSKPSSFVDIIRENFVQGTCVGFDADFPSDFDSFKKERFSLYKFYLYDYGYRRTSVEDWRTNCDGPLLTYDPGLVKGRYAESVLARENASGLFLVVKNNIERMNIPASVRSRGDISVASRQNDAYLIAGCFNITADELSGFSQVGVMRNGLLASDGRPGFLFYGPYKMLDKGSYQIRLHGQFFKHHSAIFDVVSNHGNKVHFQGSLCPQGCRPGEVLVSFSLAEKVTDLEIRLRVGKEDQVSIRGYKIDLAVDSQ